MVLADINVGILYLFAISSLGVYGIIMAGWASNSKYAFLGALRSAAQMVSYEVSIGFVIITVLLCVGSLNLSDIVRAQRDGTRLGLPNWFFDWPLLPMFVIFFISALAETNRAPFDLPDGRGGTGRRLQRRIFGDGLRAVLPRRIRQHDPDERDDVDPVPRRLAAAARHRAVGLAAGPDLARAQDLPGACSCFLWVRATFPRYRYDQLMRLGWKVFLPLSLVWLVLTAGALILFDWLPR